MVKISLKGRTLKLELDETNRIHSIVIEPNNQKFKQYLYVGGEPDHYYEFQHHHHKKTKRINIK